MSTLRQRPGKAHGKADTSDKTDEPTRIPRTDVDGNTDEKPSLSPFVRLKRYMATPRGKRRNSIVFLLGGLFGIFVALFFANHNDVINLDALLDLNLDALIDVIPQGILSDAKEFTVCLL
jgi:phospholipid:diacylglycerol acyltransferase